MIKLKEKEIYIFENGDYYIGQWKNGLRDGKGIDYYRN